MISTGAWSRKTGFDRSRLGKPWLTGLWVAAFCVSVSGCTSSNMGLGSSGETGPRSAALVNDPDSAAGMDPALLEGVEMNVATEPSAEITAYAPEEVPPAPEMATDREGAVRQIRAKANSVVDAPPNVFDRGYSTVPRMSTERQEELRREMAARAERNAAAIRSDEADRKAAEIRRLRQEAQTHYNKTLDNIED